jgi:AcrR family transcriptional regulator
LASQEKVPATVQRIESALLAAMVDKPYAQVTITELLEKAHVGRATFYRHFKDTTEVIDSVGERIIEDFRHGLEMAYEELGVGAQPIDVVTHALPSLYEHRDALRILWGPNGDMNYAYHLNTLYRPWIEMYFTGIC